MWNRFLILMTLFMSLVCARSTRADVVYHNGSPDRAAAYDMNASAQAEDIIPAIDGDENYIPFTITGFRFWTIEAPGAFKGSITFDFANDQAGAPQNLVGAQTITSLSRIATGAAVPNFPGAAEYVYEVSFAPMTIDHHVWLVLHNGPLTDVSSNGLFGWESTGEFNELSEVGHAAPGPFYDDWSSSGEHALQLLGPATPEPSAVGLLGIVGAFTLRRRRR